MSEPFVFDPRDTRFKDPFGAALCGASLTVCCRPLTEEGFVSGVLSLYHEFADRVEDIPLEIAGTEDGRTFFRAAFTAPKEAELSWYHFRFRRKDGSEWVLDPSGYRNDGRWDSWQLTTYAENTTPMWFGEGVTYQIFPDRFCRTGIPDPTGMIGDRLVHEDWEEQQEWRPDEKGVIRNRDFFGGSLKGITSRLDYLAELSVTTLYLCPIFESASNHRYNTADYTKIDPMLGTEEDFRELCAEAKKRGIRVMLDGVFNHTGSQSLYFNEDGFYPTLGAAQSKDSPYYDWYQWKHWPDDYESWWGIKTLPNVEESHPAYLDFIIENEDSVLRHWLRAGASGWRLDVADELPDVFLEKARAAMDETVADGVLIGEVWEDGSNKISYDRRRRYFHGKQLHGIMNYPFRTAALDFLRFGDAADFMETMERLRENYPPAAYLSAMNSLGTHDTARILTLLGAGRTPETRAERAAYRLGEEERAKGTALLRLGAMILYTFPGSPTVYYGDEAGMEGFEDPFNRSTYPWGREDIDLRGFFIRLGRLRKERASLRRGSIRYLKAEGPVLSYLRETENERTAIAVNAHWAECTVSVAWPAAEATDLLTGEVYHTADGHITLHLPPRSGVIFE